LRVIAGIYGSRKLHALRGVALRPTSDRLRETLFNILGAAVQDSLFVDLFAGSGAVGIEALSRGARRAVFVENHPAGAALLRRNLQSLGIAIESGAARRIGFAGGAELLVADAAEAIDSLAARGVRADFIFADPPYADADAYADVLRALDESELLVPFGVAILEHSRREPLRAVAGGVERFRVLEQGDSVLSFYRKVKAA
jgi:16S rRNA (guanine966-N2)-methyltransferase